MDSETVEGRYCLLVNGRYCFNLPPILADTIVASRLHILTPNKEYKILGRFLALYPDVKNTVRGHIVEKVRDLTIKLHRRTDDTAVDNVVWGPPPALIAPLNVSEFRSLVVYLDFLKDVTQPHMKIFFNLPPKLHRLVDGRYRLTEGIITRCLDEFYMETPYDTLVKKIRDYIIPYNTGPLSYSQYRGADNGSGRRIRDNYRVRRISICLSSKVADCLSYYMDWDAPPYSPPVPAESSTAPSSSGSSTGTASAA